MALRSNNCFVHLIAASVILASPACARSVAPANPDAVIADDARDSDTIVRADAGAEIDALPPGDVGLDPDVPSIDAPPIDALPPCEPRALPIVRRSRTCGQPIRPLAATTSCRAPRATGCPSPPPPNSTPVTVITSCLWVDDPSECGTGAIGTVECPPRAVGENGGFSGVLSLGPVVGARVRCESAGAGFSMRTGLTPGGSLSIAWRVCEGPVPLSGDCHDEVSVSGMEDAFEPCCTEQFEYFFPSAGWTLRLTVSLDWMN